MKPKLISSYGHQTRVQIKEWRTKYETKTSDFTRVKGEIIIPMSTPMKEAGKKAIRRIRNKK